MDNTKNFQRAVSDALATESNETTPAGAVPATAERTGRRKRGLLIAGGALVGTLVLAGGGFAAGAAVADDDYYGYEYDDDRDDYDDDFDDDVYFSSMPAQRDARTPFSQRDTQQRDTPAAPRATYGAASADELIDILDAAAAVASGEPVSIDMRRDGSARVTLKTTTGGEIDVRVTANGKASIISTERPDRDDTAPRHTLDAASVEAIVAAALERAPGRIVDVDADDDRTSPYDVTVLTDNRRMIDIDLNARFDILHTDTDN